MWSCGPYLTISPSKARSCCLRRLSMRKGSRQQVFPPHNSGILTIMSPILACSLQSRSTGRLKISLRPSSTNLRLRRSRLGSLQEGIYFLRYKDRTYRWYRRRTTFVHNTSSAEFMASTKNTAYRLLSAFLARPVTQIKDGANESNQVGPLYPKGAWTLTTRC